MDAQSAADLLQQPWRVQCQDINQVKAAWQAVCQENPWSTMQEWSPGDLWPFCTPCRRWSQDDHAASRYCITQQRWLGNTPGPILSSLIEFKHAQRKQDNMMKQDDHGYPHCTQRPLPLPATVT